MQTVIAPQQKLRLTDEQVQTYQREGYLIVQENIFPDAQFERLKAHFEDQLDRLEPSVRPEAMDVPHFTDPALFEWLLADEVLDLIEPILGPDIALWSSHFICKPKGDGRRVPWHEDSAYWKGKLDPMEVCTVWVAIDPSTTANGCMYVVPSTHFNGFSDYEPVDRNQNVFASEIKPSQRNDALAKPCECLASSTASSAKETNASCSPSDNSHHKTPPYSPSRALK